MRRYYVCTLLAGAHVKSSGPCAATVLSVINRGDVTFCSDVNIQMTGHASYQKNRCGPVESKHNRNDDKIQVVDRRDYAYKGVIVDVRR